jgi:hypothetical protein
MQKDKNGDFESFPQFLARTENIISFMADVEASLPSSHNLLGGNQGAVLWLGRFLDLVSLIHLSSLVFVYEDVSFAYCPTISSLLLQLLHCH